MSNRLITYDRQAQRVWICSQRCHHGSVGVCAILLGLVRRQIRGFALPLGLILVAHDWHDRSLWFARDRLASKVLDAPM
jgi:hypothetical protein